MPLILISFYVPYTYRALKYHRKYMKRISFDNHYITDYFRRIDDRRVRQGRSTLLPLKSYEQSDFITVIRLKLTPEERRALLPRLLAVILQMVVVGALFTLDNLFTKLLKLLTHRDEMEIQLKGDHILEFGISGNGALARLLRKIIKEINVKHHVNHVHGIKREWETFYLIPNSWEIPYAFSSPRWCYFCSLMLWSACTAFGSKV